MPRHPGTYSTEFRRNQAIILDSGYDICYFCLHPGAQQINHIKQRRDGGTDHISNLAPAHGHDDRQGRSGKDYRCFYCDPPRACNQADRNKGQSVPYRSRDW